MSFPIERKLTWEVLRSFIPTYGVQKEVWASFRDYTYSLEQEEREQNIPTEDRGYPAYQMLALLILGHGIISYTNFPTTIAQVIDDSYLENDKLTKNTLISLVGEGGRLYYMEFGTHNKNLGVYWVSEGDIPIGVSILNLEKVFHLIEVLGIYDYSNI